MIGRKGSGKEFGMGDETGLKGVNLARIWLFTFVSSRCQGDWEKDILRSTIDQGQRHRLAGGSASRSTRCKHEEW